MIQSEWLVHEKLVIAMILWHQKRDYWSLKFAVKNDSLETVLRREYPVARKAVKVVDRIMAQLKVISLRYTHSHCIHIGEQPLNPLTLTKSVHYKMHCL